MLTFPAIGWGNDFYLDLKEGCYKSTSYEDIMPINAQDYKSWNKVTCNQPHHIEVFHVQRLARQTIDESTVGNVCVSSHQNLFNKYPPVSANEPGPYLRWFWPDDDEYKKYGSIIICYLHAGDAQNYIGLKNNPDQVFTRLGNEIKKYLAGQNNQTYEIIKEESIIAESFRVLPFNRNTLAFYRGYEFGNPEEGYGRNIAFVKGLYDLKNKRVIAIDISKETEDSAFMLSENSLSIDTAAYILNQKVRAIGFRITSSHTSWPGWEGDARDPMIWYTANIDFKKLLEVNLEVYRWGNMRIIGKGADLKFSMSNNITNGYSDIIIQANIYNWGYWENCTEYLKFLQHIGVIKNIGKKEWIHCTKRPLSEANSWNTKEKILLKYDGVKYVAPSNEPWWLSIRK